MTGMDLETLAREGRKQALYVPAPAHTVDLGSAAVERLLPHRDPFLLIDGIDAVDLAGHCIAGRRRIAPEDPVFRGHFPGDPLYPGVLQVEAVAQLGLCLFGLMTTPLSGAAGARRSRAIKIHHAAFFEPVRPGDALTISAKVLDANSMTGVVAGQVARGSTICSFAVTEVYFVDP